MALKLSDDVKTLVRGANFAHLATLMPDGAPQVAPVWVDLDGDLVLVSLGERVQLRSRALDPERHAHPVEVRQRLVEVCARLVGPAVQAAEAEQALRGERAHLQRLGKVERRAITGFRLRHIRRVGAGFDVRQQAPHARLLAAFLAIHPLGVADLGSVGQPSRRQANEPRRRGQSQYSSTV